MKKFTVVLVAFAFSLFLVPVAGTVNAQSTNGNEGETGQVRENIQNRVDEYVEGRCARVSERVDNRIRKYDENKQRHIDNYDRITNNVSDTVAKLESEGYDVTEVKNDLTELNSMILEFANGYTEFINTLRGSKNFACGNSEGEFRARIEESRNQLEDVRANTTEIKNFIQDVLREDLEELKDQKPAN